MDVAEAPRNEDMKTAAAVDADADADADADVDADVDAVTNGAHADGNERQALEDTEKVMKYLKVCGIDPSQISVDDIDPSSLAFIVDWAENNPVDTYYGLDQGNTGSAAGAEEKETKEASTRSSGVSVGVGVQNSTNNDDGGDKDVLAMAVSELVASDDIHNDPERKVEQEKIRQNPLPTLSKRDICSSCIEPNCKGIDTGITTADPKELNENEQKMKKISTEMTKSSGASGASDEWSKLADACREHSAALEAIVKPMAEAEAKVKVEKINYDELEPWQRALFQRLDNQEKAIEKCQIQIQKLMFIAQDQAVDRITRKVYESLEHGRNISRESSTSAPTPAPAQNAPRGAVDVVAPDPNANANALPNAIAVDNTPVMDKLLHIPRSCYKFIITSRPVRVVKLLRHEAANFRHPGNPRFFDIQLMFKLAFICMFLRARISGGSSRNLKGTGGKKVRRGKGIIFEVIEMTRENSAVMLPISAVIVYFIQTGLLSFVYQNIVKNNVIARVWRNEDLGDDNDAAGGPQVVEAVGGARDAIGVRDNAENEVQNMENNALLRRGRRDRAPIAGQRDAMGINDVRVNGGEGDAPAGANARRQNNNPLNLGGIQAAVRADFANRLDDTFMAGVIDPTNEQVRPGDGNRNDNDRPNANIPREEILLVHMLEGMKDVLYLFGSFFLSLFPMWHPRAREGVPEAADTADDVTEEINPGPNNDEIAPLPQIERQNNDDANNEEIAPLPQVEGQNNDDVEEDKEEGDDEEGSEGEDEISESDHNEEER